MPNPPRQGSTLLGRIARLITVNGYWLRSFGPIAIAVSAGWFIFEEEIRRSIESTPHPALVYTIFVAAAMGVVFAAGALAHFVLEESLALRWRAAASIDERSRLVRRVSRHSLLAPVLALLNGEKMLSTRMRQTAVENELKAIEKRLASMLGLPQFIGGALVGLGLVGTFIGLLGTLEDLGKLFATLGSSGVASTDAGVMFGDMVRRLQEPMRGMGTAFVASLYGLLGSLLLGLTVLSVRKTASTLIDRIRQIVREEGYGASTAADEASENAPPWMDPAHWAEMLDQMRAQHQAVAAESRSINAAVGSLGERVHELAGALATRTQVDAQVQRLMDTGVHWVDSWTQISEQLTALRATSETTARRSLQMQAEQLDAMSQVTTVLSHVEAGISTQSGRLAAYVDQRENAHAAELRSAITISREMQDALQLCRDEFTRTASLMRSMVALQADVLRQQVNLETSLEALAPDNGPVTADFAPAPAR
jgi:hypothetical protein